LPEWYKFTIVCLNSLLYLLFFFPGIFIPPLFVFYFIILVHFFSIYPSKELNTALQIVDTFETAGVPFACVMRNAFRKNELNLHIYGFISSKEKNQIFEEVVEMYADDKVFNEITLN
ncbi:hypothetical protein, partial [Ruminococcus sp.]|uniref:hypothetical protein n=1 Tax=Ruminococcus sp. TaxID=41978 RepID=UPI0025CBF6C7